MTSEATASKQYGPYVKPVPEARDWPYMCDICKALFEKKAEYINHLKNDHSGEMDPDVLLSIEAVAACL